MHEETVINQQAQDHAVACALFARLLGQLALAFIRLPVLNKNLDERVVGSIETENRLKGDHPIARPQDLSDFEGVGALRASRPQAG